MRPADRPARRAVRLSRARRPEDIPVDMGCQGLQADEGFTPREPTALHTLRLQAVHEALRACGARSVADLGCGDGALVLRLLADPVVDCVVAIDTDLAALGRLERAAAALEGRQGQSLILVHGSFARPHPHLQQVDAVVMLETIEHIELSRLSGVEQQVFGEMRPATVILTTPNQEYNELFGMAPGQMREPGHHFEWSRQRLRTWAAGVALRQAYDLSISGIGEVDPHRGSPTQMAVFVRRSAGQPPAAP